MFANIFSKSTVSLFILYIGSFTEEIFNLDINQFIIFSSFYESYS